MRRAGVLLFAMLSLGSASCMRVLFPDYECDDECFPGATQCIGNSTQFCILEPFFGCLVWVEDENCDGRAATCVDSECVCPIGTVPCPPHRVCTFLDSDPLNCGACGLACSGACADGQCVP